MAKVETINLIGNDKIAIDATSFSDTEKQYVYVDREEFEQQQQDIKNYHDTNYHSQRIDYYRNLNTEYKETLSTKLLRFITLGF